MDLIACSMIARGLISAAALGVTLWLTHSLLAAVLALAVARTTVLLVYDRPTASVGESLETSDLRAQVSVFFTSLPLGIVLMLIALVAQPPSLRDRTEAWDSGIGLLRCGGLVRDRGFDNCQCTGSDCNATACPLFQRPMSDVSGVSPGSSLG